MKQSFALATLVTLTLASPIAYALGLGQPAVHSYLHAPLNVSIPLVDADQYDPGQLRVRVAGRPAFQAVGLEWNALAAGVRAEVHAGSDTPEVRLTSTAPATTPWLDLLLTLSSPDGDVTQNVTLLFDPSVNAHQGDAAENTVDPSGARALVAGIDSTASSTRVHNGDTLWSVAERLKPASASIEQVMLALVAANPGAFPSGNINGLNAGFELSVPTTAQMLSRRKAQAAQTIDYMNTAWRIRGPNGPVHVPLGPSGTAGPPSAEPEEEAQAEAAATSPALNSEALDVAKALGQGAAASELEQDQATLERIIGQRDRLREEVSQLKAEMSQLTDELALQEVELARQEMRGATPLPALPAEEGTAVPDGSAENTAVSPPASELAIAGRGMMAIASEYRWPLAGAALLLLVLLVWQCRRRPLSSAPEAWHDEADDSDDAMLGRSQAAGLASSRRDEQRGTEEVAFGPSSQDNTRSTS
ncbi:type IV pilus assembly protein FimV [Vreelandella subglaciescola]|jgi:pilus assembly protein FimV|uniref:Pilus assembly protein FimV n=1 Tax=Vreelandella subglaciescola TaxID=29571 RepID=A0A1M7EAP7_9GAMM|nr:FimV/HubP family polar landmark protein [Halomonas subglaciescola]SHL88835.1 pilus assembly protein FimV [Halomonas subglaciescola]